MQQQKTKGKTCEALVEQEFNILIIMLYKNLVNELAVANSSGAMEADTISKNGHSSKSHMSRSFFSKKIFFLALIVCVLSSSCVSTQKTRSIKTVDISHGGVIQKPVIVDLAIGQTKVQGTASGTSMQVEMLKNEAVRDALSKAGNADVMIEPNFSITTRGGSTQVEVTGFPGTYKNFRTIEESDSAWLENMGGINQARIYDPINKQTSTVDQQNNKGRVWGAIASIGLLVILLAAL